MAEKEQPKKKDVYFTIRRVGDVWDVDGQLNTEDMKDVLDLIMILMTNAVRVALTVTDINRSLKPMEKALNSQLKDIIKAEAKELMKDAPSKEVSDDKASESTGQEATADTIQKER